MSEYRFISAKSVEDATSILSNEGETSCLTAGTTNILTDIRYGRRKPCLLVDISRIKELAGITFDGTKVRIGSLTTIAEIASSSLIEELAPALADAAQHFADPVTRNRATIGGNIAHASPAADSAPPLLCFDAEVLISSVDGCRRVPVCDFFLGVNKTSLTSSEIITAFEFLPCKDSAFIKVGLRNAMAISVASVAVAINKDSNGCIERCRIAFGSLAPRPVRAYNTEKLLCGKKPDTAITEEVKAAILKDISPIDDIRATREYRISVAETILERALVKEQ